MMNYFYNKHVIKYVLQRCEPGGLGIMNTLCDKWCTLILVAFFYWVKYLEWKIESVLKKKKMASKIRCKNKHLFQVL